MGTADTIRFT